MIEGVKAEDQIAALKRKRKIMEIPAEPSKEAKEALAAKRIAEHQQVVDRQEAHHKASIFDHPKVGAEVNAAGKHAEDPTLRRVAVQKFGEGPKQFPPTSELAPPPPSSGVKAVTLSQPTGVVQEGTSGQDGAGSTTGQEVPATTVAQEPADKTAAPQTQPVEQPAGSEQKTAE